MLLANIQKDLNEALKGKRETEVSTLRFLLAGIKNKEIEKQEQLTDEEVGEVIAKQVKERKESIEAFKAGKREDLVAKEQAEMEILNKYLPQQLGEEELVVLVKNAIAESGAAGIADFGKVMAVLMPQVKGKADGAIVSQKVRELLA